MQTNTHIETTQHASEDRLLTFAAARGVVGVSRSMVYLLLEKGDFPKPVKVGRKNFFSQRELQEWIHVRLENRKIGGLK